MKIQPYNGTLNKKTDNLYYFCQSLKKEILKKRSI